MKRLQSQSEEHLRATDPPAIGYTKASPLDEFPCSHFLSILQLHHPGLAEWGV